MTALVQLEDGAPVRLVRANWGRFVVDCVLCPSALEVSWGDVDRLGVERWDATSRRHLVRCLDCGSPVVAQWPDLDFVRGVVRLLSMRPDVSTRNWHPGETLVDLVAENGAHGILERFLVEAPPGTALLSVDDARVRLDELPAAPQLALTETDRLTIASR